MSYTFFIGVKAHEWKAITILSHHAKIGLTKVMFVNKINKILIKSRGFGYVSISKATCTRQTDY